MNTPISPVAALLLEAHKPNQHAFLCIEIGLRPNVETVAQVDAAYAELVATGYMAVSHLPPMPVYHGAIPRRLFKLTDVGIAAKAKP